MARTDETDVVRLAILVLAAFVLLPLLAMALFVPMMGMTGWMGTDHMAGTGSGVWLLMPLFWILVLGGLGYLAYRAVSGEGDGQDRAMEELRQAYARGELSSEEFEERREKLRQN
jgi:putative membrane protein